MRAIINIKLLFILIITGLFLNSCDILIDIEELQQVKDTGGYVFYDKGDYSDGWRYLVAAPTDQAKIAWGPLNNIGGTLEQTGKGEFNTTIIVNTLADVTPSAAKYCYNLQLNGFSDWFLPSIDELKLMYKVLYKNEKGDFLEDSYWSSNNSDIANAKSLNMTTGVISDANKASQFRVRAIRAY